MMESSTTWAVDASPRVSGSSRAGSGTRMPWRPNLRIWYVRTDK